MRHESLNPGNDLAEQVHVVRATTTTCGNAHAPNGHSCRVFDYFFVLVGVQVLVHDVDSVSRRACEIFHASHRQLHKGISLTAQLDDAFIASGADRTQLGLDERVYRLHGSVGQCLVHQRLPFTGVRRGVGSSSPGAPAAKNARSESSAAFSARRPCCPQKMPRSSLRNVMS